jgi:hypothetical protein
MAWSAPVSASAVTAVKSTAGPVRAAESGAVDTAATVGPLAIGARVEDGAGTPLGNIARLTTDKDGASIAQVRQGQDVSYIPVRDLTVHRGAVISRLTAADLKASGAVH